MEHKLICESASEKKSLERQNLEMRCCSNDGCNWNATTAKQNLALEDYAPIGDLPLPLWAIVLLSVCGLLLIVIACCFTCCANSP